MSRVRIVASLLLLALVGATTVDRCLFGCAAHAAPESAIASCHHAEASPTLGSAAQCPDEHDGLLAEVGGDLRGARLSVAPLALLPLDLRWPSSHPHPRHVVDRRPDSSSPGRAIVPLPLRV